MKAHTTCRIVPALLTIALLPLAGTAEICLWKATSERGILYLQGSVHVLREADYPLDPAIEQAYAQCEALVLEADINRMEAAETQQMLLEKARLPAGRTLEDELSTEVYSELAGKLTAAGLSLEACQPYKPWFVTLNLMMLRLEAMKLDPDLGLDRYFHRKALADKKEEIALESVEFQIGLFDLLSEGDQDAYILYSLKELEQLENLLDEMLAAWKAGNLEKLDAMLSESFKDSRELEKRFVTERNKAWAKKLDELVKPEKPCMVVVGVAHFAGKEGLLELLKARGYTVEQL